MSTIHTMGPSRFDEVLRLRKRPGSKHPNHLIVQKPFGKAHTKWMLIPRAIDSYNHSMNAVDTADQYQSINSTKRRIYKGWKALFHFLLKQALVNAFLLLNRCTEDRQEQYNHQRQFRTDLCKALFTHAARSRKHHLYHINQDFTAHVPRRKHELAKANRGYYIKCRANARQRLPRRVLGKISHNPQQRSPQTTWIYKYYTVHLCYSDISPYFDEFHRKALPT